MFREFLRLGARAGARVLGATDRAAARAGAPLVVATALAYYSLYFRHGLNLGGEGGTTAVIAMRLNEGLRPIADTFLGYNVLWFYPVAWLFQWTGPDYLAMRAFFFVLCGVTAVTGFLVVRRLAGSGLLALAAGISLVLIPGMMFRNYMGLLGVGNQLALTLAFLAPPEDWRRRAALIAVAGGVVGLTFLVRVEVGWLMLAIWLALLVMSLFEPRARNGRTVLLGLAGGLVAMGAVHAPFAWDAARRGYAGEFWGQYSSYFALVRWELGKLAAPAPPERSAACVAGAGDGMASAAGSDGGGGEIQSRRPRPEVSAIWQGRRARERYFAAAVYLPLVVTFGMLAGGACAMVLGWRRGDAGLWRDGLAVGTLTGCALTLFPQYFFFRPDTPHITEFMAPFQVALASAAGLCVRRARGHPTPVSRSLAGLAGIAFAVTVWIHFGHAWRKESAGTIAARKAGGVEFAALNNVRVIVPPGRAEALAGLRDAVLANSGPGDWVVCLPYSPTINFMTDRPSYLWDLYMDNTLAGGEFEKEKIAEMEKYDPAVVVVDQRAINKVEASRFRNWAPQWYEHIRSRYELVGKFETNEVYARRAVAEGPP